jgi:hypothetical protein
MFAAIQPYIPGIISFLIAIFPSLIVAATPYPKEQGWLRVASQILNLFSGLTHSDSPGTLKLPLTQSSPPAVVGAPVASPASAAKVLVLALLALHGLTACAGWGTAIEADVLSCGASIGAPVASGVFGALTGAGNQVEGSLEALGLTYGVQAVSCVVQDMVAQEEAKLAASQAAVRPAGYSPTELPNLVLIVRGEQYLRGWHLTGAKLVHHKFQ